MRTPDYPIDGRELHAKLEIGTAYKDWFPRVCEYGFTEDTDFRSFLSESTGGRPSANHLLTLSMAKEICMLQRTEQGRLIRRYLIEVEAAWNTPEQLMARALQVTDQTIHSLHVKMQHLEADNSRLTEVNQIAAPKAEYFDQLVNRNLLINFRDTAKEFQVKQTDLVNFLLDNKYIFRDQKGRLTPTAGKGDGLFEMKECFSEKNKWSGVQTLITPKGRETFRLLMAC